VTQCLESKCGSGSAAAGWFLDARECAPSPQGRPNRPPEHPTRYVADAILEAAPLSERHRLAQLKITMRSSGKAAGSISISAPDETTTTLGDHAGLVLAELITLPTQQQAP
jgi:hypothetical protein